MLASDGGSAEVVHALIIAVAITGISKAGLIRAMRPGGDAPLEGNSAPHRPCACEDGQDRRRSSGEGGFRRE